MNGEKYAVYVKCVNCLFTGMMKINACVRVNATGCPNCHCETLTAVERTGPDKRDGG